MALGVIPCLSIRVPSGCRTRRYGPPPPPVRSRSHDDTGTAARHGVGGPRDEAPETLPVRVDC